MKVYIFFFFFIILSGCNFINDEELTMDINIIQTGSTFTLFITNESSSDVYFNIMPMFDYTLKSKVVPEESNLFMQDFRDFIQTKESLLINIQETYELIVEFGDVLSGADLQLSFVQEDNFEVWQIRKVNLSKLQ